MPARRRVVAASGVALLAALLIGAPTAASAKDRNGDGKPDRTTTTTTPPRRTTTTHAPSPTSTTRTTAAGAAPTSSTTSTPTTHATTSTTAAKVKRSARYIVVLKKGNRSRDVADDQAKTKHIKIDRVFGNAIRGFAADIPDDVVNAIKKDKRVSYVQKDMTVRAFAQTLPWGVEKVSRSGTDWSSTHPGDGSGSVNFDVYVLDSGIQATSDLNGGTEFNSRGGQLTDCAGHGTYTAAIVGAKDDSQGVVGVAPGVRLHGVRVLDCQGRGTTTDVVTGLDWIVAHGVHPAMIQMSFGAQGIDRAFDDSITRAVNAGFTITDAAGNDHVDACKQSPAHMGTLNGVITVGATTKKDTPASFSNFGSCVDVWAPGTRIVSDFLGDNLAVGSGTSAAAPHVAGVAALYLSQNTGASPATVEAAVKSAAVHISRGRLRASSASF